MEKIFEVDLDDVKIENYEKILSRFGNWKKYKREINLNQLLEEGKKIQFDIEIQNTTMVFYISVSDSQNSHTTSLTNACSVMKKLTFIILENKILKLEAELKLLDTNWGKEIKKLTESGLKLKLYQHINIEGQVDNFYFELPKEAA
jgi:hypothetical protein